MAGLDGKGDDLGQLVGVQRDEGLPQRLEALAARLDDEQQLALALDRALPPVDERRRRARCSRTRRAPAPRGSRRCARHPRAVPTVDSTSTGSLTPGSSPRGPSTAPPSREPPRGGPAAPAGSSANTGRALISARVTGRGQTLAGLELDDDQLRIPALGVGVGLAAPPRPGPPPPSRRRCDRRPRDRPPSWRGGS